jgi:CheY-like chemotaxis protein
MAVDENLPATNLSQPEAGAAPWSAQQALESAAAGVVVVDPRGAVLWQNRALRAYPRPIQALIQTNIAELLSQCESQQWRAESGASWRRTVSAGDYFLDLRLAPMPGPDGRVERIVASVWDLSDTRRLQEKINAIDAAGRELVRLDSDASARGDVGQRLQLLEEKILRYCHDLLRFDHLVIRVLDRRANQLETVVAGGLSENAKSMVIAATAEGGGISGYVAATGQAYVCPDVSRDPRYLPGLESAQSSLTVPLRLNEQVVGTLNVESDQRAAFNDDDRQLAEIFGRYVAIALHTLQLLAVERHAAAGQVAADVHAELEAPLTTMQHDLHTLEGAVPESLRERVHAVTERVARMKDALRSTAEVPAVERLTGAPTQQQPELVGKRILVADDEEIICDTVADVLTNAGAIATRARDGAEAVALIESQPFELVISDIKMPHRNGYEVFAAVRKAQPQCAVILITGFGYDPEHSIVRADKEGLAGVLFKPFKHAQLIDEILTALRGKH